MSLIDLTLPVNESVSSRNIFKTEEMRISNQAGNYTAIIHHFAHNSMTGTYIDFPSHVKETDNGTNAANYPPEKIFRVPAAAIHLDRADGSGKFGADDLAAGCPDWNKRGALILNALGMRRFDQIAERSVYLGKEAVRWIVEKGFHLLISDVYESNTDPQNVFPDLFRHGVATVCYPVNLHLLTQPGFRVTVLFPRFGRATQLPCRILAETGCGD
jgi:kynurenine formamidase